MVLQSSLKTYYDDNYLRGMSYIYADNGRNNYTSHASFDIKGSVKAVDLYTRNVAKINGRTFLIELREKEVRFSFMTGIYSLVSGAAMLACICIFVAVCLRCFSKSSGIDWNVDEIDPNWDVDQIRVYNMRRLQRQMSLARANESDQENWENELRNLEEENIREF